LADNIIAARVRDLLHYEPETGFFFRRKATKVRHRVDDRADKLCPIGRAAGYYYVSVAGGRYGAHRLAWLYVTGEWPKGQIDHINGDPGDNRIVNLRDVPQSLNQQNRRRSAARINPSGFVGVSFKRGRWMAALTVNRRQVYLGYYDTPQEAHAAYLKGKRTHHPGSLM